MDKKTECEIVQDLLLGYVDNVLNSESKKLVEKHLLECEECRIKLEEIRCDIKENENNQKKQIDYLKKIRRKNNIKTIVSVLGIIILICSVIYIRKFIIVNSFFNKGKESIESENIYIEKISRTSSEYVVLEKVYYKDGKFKSVRETYTNDGVDKGNQAEYGTVGTAERTFVNHDDKSVTIEKGDFTKMMNEEKSVKHVQFNFDIPFVFVMRRAFYYSIHTSYYELGREYYVLKDAFDKDNKWEVWIDKETGLPLKVNNNTIVRTFFEGTDIEKEENNMVYEYRYKFEVVTDEDVTIPDYTGYEIQYKDTNIPLENDK